MGGLKTERPAGKPQYFQNYTIVIPIMAFKIEGKEMYPIFVFAKCC